MHANCGLPKDVVFHERGLSKEGSLKRGTTVGMLWCFFDAVTIAVSFYYMQYI